jgi:hypothetical protein
MTGERKNPLELRQEHNGHVLIWRESLYSLYAITCKASLEPLIKTPELGKDSFVLAHLEDISSQSMAN